jgi:Flp pilus assembly protein TadD
MVTDLRVSDDVQHNSNEIMVPESNLANPVIQSGPPPCTEDASQSSTPKPRNRSRSRRTSTVTRSMTRALRNDADVANLKITAARLLPLLADESATEVAIR